MKEFEIIGNNTLNIPDVFPVTAAARKTLIAKSCDSLTARALHSELIYNYSGSKHISESLRRFGISDSTTYILAARFNASNDELINEEEIDLGLGELGNRTNKSMVGKHYKISGLELDISSLGDAIICRIDSRDAL